MFKILIVDDSPPIRRLMADIITLTGCEVIAIEAGDGRKAIKILAERSVDLLITDRNMGEELIRLVKFRYPDIKIILASLGFDTKAVKKAALAAGADMVVDKLKLIHVENMKHAIQKLLLK